jgi:hypothetical protein
MKERRTGDYFAEHCHGIVRSACSVNTERRSKLLGCVDISPSECSNRVVAADAIGTTSKSATDRAEIRPNG